VATSYAGNILEHLVFELGATGITLFKGVYGNKSTTAILGSVFIQNRSIYAYLGSSSSNDSFYVIDIDTNTSQTITLPVSNCKIVISPNRKKALLWTSSSRLYIYSIATTVTLSYIYNGSVIPFVDYTETLTFSSDSTLTIL
jgi:hypothetical protein